jgi:hypothetical protein
MWKLYLRNGIVYVPTVAQTEAGFYLDIEPVRSIPAMDSEALQNVLKESMSVGNPICPTPLRATFPKPVILDHAKLKSWPAFEKGAQCWTIVKKEENYKIAAGRKRSDRGWEDDPNRTEFLRNVTISAVVERIAALIKTALGDG